MKNITENTRINFGKHKNTKLRDLPDEYLLWVQNNLLNTDFHSWAVAAKKELKRREEEDAPVKGLEEQADEFLRQYGHDPKNM